MSTLTMATREAFSGGTPSSWVWRSKDGHRGGKERGGKERGSKGRGEGGGGGGGKGRGV